MKKINFVAVLSMTALIFGAISCKTNAKGVEYEPTQKLTETIVPTEAKAEYSQGLSKNYFYFGDYPQTKVAAEDLPSMSTKPASNGWYIGADGKYYGKVGDDYYLVEPILWCEVTDAYDYADGSKASLLVCETAIDCMAFYPSSEKREIDGKEVYVNNYKYSALRAFLNGYKFNNNGTEDATYFNKGFVNKAFASSVANIIKTTVVKNDGDSTDDKYNNGNWTRSDGFTGSNPTTGPESNGYYDPNVPRNYTENGKVPTICDNTNDKVFVLSLSECVEPAYGFISPNMNSSKCDELNRKTTDYAVAKGLNTTDAGYAEWLSRTPHYNTEKVRGTSVIDGVSYIYNSAAANVAKGVVPAIVVNIAK